MQRRVPVWVVGTAMAPLGCYYGFISTALPFLLKAHGFSVDRITTISAIAFLPTVWGFLVSPVVDVRYHKRFYSILFTVISALCLGGAVLAIENILLFTVLTTLGCTTTVLFGSALTGWMPDIVEEEHQSWLGAWTNIANIGAAGVFGTAVIFAVEKLAPWPAALLLAAIVAAPLLLLVWFPAPVAPKRGAMETFRNLFRDVYALCRERKCLLGLITLLSPCSCFALTNVFSGLGEDFHTPEHWVAVMGGVGVAIACSLGCFAGVPFCKRYSRRTVYIAIGLAGAAVALGTIFAPKTVVTFTVAILAYNFFQGINYTAFTSLQLQIVGANNPLAGTQMSLLAAAANVSITYMVVIDGRGYKAAGLNGLLAVDGVAAAVFCVGLLVFFRWLERRRVGADAMSTDLQM